MIMLLQICCQYAWPCRWLAPSKHCSLAALAAKEGESHHCGVFPSTVPVGMALGKVSPAKRRRVLGAEDSHAVPVAPDGPCGQSLFDWGADIVNRLLSKDETGSLAWRSPAAALQQRV